MKHAVVAILAAASLAASAQMPQNKPMTESPAMKTRPGGEKGSGLPMQTPLRSREYLVAADRKSFAMLHPDGNLCAYRGEVNGNRERTWCSGVTEGAGEYYAFVQRD